MSYVFVGFVNFCLNTKVVSQTLVEPLVNLYIDRRKKSTNGLPSKETLVDGWY